MNPFFGNSLDEISIFFHTSICLCLEIKKLFLDFLIEDIDKSDGSEYPESIFLKSMIRIPDSSDFALCKIDETTMWIDDDVLDSDIGWLWASVICWKSLTQCFQYMYITDSLRIEIVDMDMISEDQNIVDDAVWVVWYDIDDWCICIFAWIGLKYARNMIVIETIDREVSPMRISYQIMTSIDFSWMSIVLISSFCPQRCQFIFDFLTIACMSFG